MLTTAAWPAASRKRRSVSSTIQQPSPRAAIGNVFLRFQKKSPLVGMRVRRKIVTDSLASSSRYHMQRILRRKDGTSEQVNSSSFRPRLRISEDISHRF